jgi:hypothetical protein
MKRISLIAIAMFAISTMVAEVTIQTEFDGIVLGKSSRSEVGKFLTSKGLILSVEQSEVGEYGCNDVYEGVYLHDEMNFDCVITSFVDDTIISVCFKGFCDSACVEFGKPFIENVHSKYDNLESADSSLLVLSATNDAEGFKTWSRKDDESIVLTMQSDSACFCAYYAESKIFEMSMKLAFDKTKHLLPDYAEENKVYGVAGVKFGDSKTSVKSVIYSKSSRLVEEDAHSMLFTDVKIGGVTYDYARFYFSSNQLISVNLQSAFYSWRKEEALMMFEGIKDQYGRKYSNLKELKDEEDLKGYNCGAYIDGYDYMPILISFQKSLSKGGDIMYYVLVDYYHHRTDNLYDDEI